MGAHAGRAAHPALPAGRAADRGLGRRQVQRFRDAAAGTDQARLRRPAELLRQDDAAHIAWLRGSGSDPKGRGAVSSEFSFALEPAAGGTAVAVTTRLELSGSVAQYGRGSGMITEVAARILAEFERNLCVMLTQGAGGAAVVTMAGDERPGGAAADAGGASPREATAPGFDAGHGSPQAQALLFQAQAVLAQAQAVLAQVQSRGSPAGRGESPGRPPN